jgi:hypothetical protein
MNSEAVHVFPWMNWGHENGAGHYLDLCSAALGLSLFSVGYLLHVVNTKNGAIKLLR